MSVRLGTHAASLKCSIGCCWLFLSVMLAGATIDPSLQMQLGNPSNASADTNNFSHYLIQRPIEAIDYNNTLGEPNWASWDLTAGDANGAVNRQDSFAADTNLPTGFHQVGANDYSGSGYDRGHLCPSADRTDSTNDNDQTFLMSNMMPQAPDNNRIVWANFEDYCRSLCQAPSNSEMLIICGPSGFTGAKINTNGYVSIPQYTWKIAVVVPPGPGLATNRITSANRVIAIKVPNTNGVSSDWQNFVTSVNQIQVDTGFTFFTALPPDVATALRAKVDGQTNPPPAIFALSPTSGAAGTNVVITGTNFNAASAVAFNGVDAAFSVDSNTQITAIVPTNAASGFVSVTTSSGTAISTNSFVVTGGGGGIIFSGMLAGWDVSTQSNFGPSPFSPSTNGPYLSVGGLTRGSGATTSGTGGAHGWGGTGFTSVAAAAAAAAGQYVTFTLSVSNGCQMSLTSISRLDCRRSNLGPTNGVLQFQIGSGGFTDLAGFTYSNAANGATNGPVDLTGYPALQNIGAGTNVTFRIVNYNGGSSQGTWYIFDTANSTAPDLALQGIITQLAITNPPAAAPVFQSPLFAGHQFQFTVSGTAGSNYVVQMSTNLAFPGWIPLATNPAPFVFTDTNTDLSAGRFYRALVAP